MRMSHIPHLSRRLPILLPIILILLEAVFSMPLGSWAHGQVSALGASNPPSKNMDTTSPISSRVTRESKDLYVVGGRTIYKLRASNGALQWVSQPAGDQIYSLAHPLVTEKQIFFVDQSSELYAISTGTGRITWKKKLPPQGYANLPFLTAANDILFTSTSDNVLYALKQSNGEVLWTYRFSDSIEMSETHIQVLGTTVLIGSEDGFIYAIHMNSGKLVWKAPVKGPADFSSITIAIHIEQDQLYTAVTYLENGSEQTISGIFVLQGKDGTLHWHTEVPDAIAHLSVNGKSIYFSTSGPIGQDAHLYALERQTGKIRWTFTQPGLPPVMSLTATRDTLYYTVMMKAVLYALDTVHGTIRWIWYPGLQPAGGLVTAPIVSHKRIYLHAIAKNGVNATFALDKERHILWQHRWEQDTTRVPPLVVNQTLYMGTVNVDTATTTIAALSLENGSEIWRQSIPEIWTDLLIGAKSG